MLQKLNTIFYLTQDLNDHFIIVTNIKHQKCYVFFCTKSSKSAVSFTLTHISSWISHMSIAQQLQVAGACHTYRMAQV